MPHSGSRPGHERINVHVAPYVVTAIAGRDSRWLRDERPGHPLHALRVLVLDTEHADPERVVNGIRTQIAGHTLRHPTFRRRLETGRLSWSGWEWSDAAVPDLDVHVRVTILPAGAVTIAVNRAVADLASSPLDRSRPLWDVTVLVDRTVAVAVVLRMHHALADGSVVSRVLGDLFGGDTQPSPTVQAPLRPALARLPGLVADTARTVRRNRPSFGVPGISRSAEPLSAPGLPWSVQHPTRRVVASCSLSLTDIREAARSGQCRVGEVALAVVAGALRRYLRDRGQLPVVPLVATVPVSLWSRGEVPAVGNGVGAVSLALATQEPDPVRRQTLVRDSFRSALTVFDGRDPALLNRWRDLDPMVWILQRTASRLARGERPGPSTNVAISVSRGPSRQLWCGPAAVNEIRSIGFLSDDIGMSVGAWSYLDRMTFAILTCPDARTDVTSLAAEFPPALSEAMSSSTR